MNDVNDMNDMNDVNDVNDVNNASDVNDVNDASDANDVNDASDANDVIDEIPANHKKRIVAVDDSNMVLKTLKNVLEEEDFELHAFSAGTRALEYLEHKDKMPDLIILDIEMPIMNGYDVLKRIRKIYHLRCVPVIFLTSHNEKKQVVKAATGGVNDYVVKPIDKEILLKKIYSLLNK